MDLDEAGVISLDMIGRSIFLQQQRQLVVQHHFPQFPVGVITEKTDVNGAQNAQVIDGCGYHKSMLAGRIHTRRDNQRCGCRLFRLFHEAVNDPFQLLLVYRLQQVVESCSTNSINHVLIISCIEHNLHIPSDCPP